MAGEHRCREYNQLLSAYLDGEVTAFERTELLQHLATCAACRATMDEYRSIGTQLRGLPPVQTPDELTDAIYAQTVDAPPRRLSLFTSRAGYPIAAAAAVLLVFVVAVFLLVDGYERRIDPSIVGSEPVGDLVSINEEIRISFNKAMDRESVEEALIIQPTSEKDRLERRWEGNTLIIGGNAPLKPSSQYSISFSSLARDKWGNPLDDPFELAFGTSTTLAFDPIETAAPTPTVEESAPAAPTASPTPAQRGAQATPTPEQETEPLTVPTSSYTPAPPSSNGNGSSGQGTADPTPPPVEEPERLDPTPTPEPTDTPQPTATPEPDPVQAEEPTQVPALPTETPVPEPTAVPTEAPATPTTEPEPTQTPVTGPEPVSVEGSFGNVYWSNEPVRTRLGDATGLATDGINALELDFQYGKMFLEGGSDTIYVMLTAGTWESIPNTAEELPEFEPGDQEGLWKPGGVLGYHWHEDPDMQNKLGQALESQEQAFTTIVQQFDGGVMLSSADGFIYVIYYDNSWELYPDAGPLADGEPTPVP